LGLEIEGDKIIVGKSA